MFAQDVGHGRRRSVDVGGLALALGNQGLGHGWGGWEEHDKGEIRYAELLSDMYTHTQMTVNQRDNELPPIAITQDTRCRLIKSLDSWHFEPHKLPEEEVLSCTLILFETILRIEGMRDDIGVSLNQISTFLTHLRQIYRTQNSYHNFQHALDVLQATHTFLHAAGVVPPVSILLESDDRVWRPDKSREETPISCLNNDDLFTIFIAAIGHDVGHPGFTNVFMKNAKAPLSLVYDDKSALEQMHYALLLQVMRHHGFGHLLDCPRSGQARRKLLWSTVLATDMSVHRDFMDRFESMANGGAISAYTKKILICQALIKCADISNPSRPHPVSQHWANALAAEWSSQALLEKHFQLPNTVQPSSNPLKEAASQVWFINEFAKPLLDLTAKAIPELSVFAIQCAENLKIWEKRRSQLSASSSASSPIEAGAGASLQMPEDYLDAFPLTLPAQLLATQEEQSLPVWQSSYPREDQLSDYSSDSQHSETFSERPAIVLPCIATSFSSITPPFSPSDSSSFHLSPRSEVSSSSFIPRPPSAGSSSASSSSDATASMRAAYQVGPRKKKSFCNRNSWNPNSSLSWYDQDTIPSIQPALPRVAIVTAFETGHRDMSSR